MSNNNYFPQGIASGDAFLGRKKEIARLQHNISSNHHTLLIASRRFGKTSLAKHALKNLALPYGEANFYLSLTEKSVELKILGAIQDIINAASGNKPETALSKIAGFLAKSKKKFTFGIKGLAGIEILPTDHDDIPENILSGLTMLESFLVDQKKQAVLFFDEIQEIHKLTNSIAIQGAIREFAQNTKNVSIIFSGSNRRLIHHLFDDDSMPLYELCERIPLGRVDEADYIHYINDVAIKTKGGKLHPDVVRTILKVTHRHPKRTYNLCYELWMNHASHHISCDNVLQAWNHYVAARAGDIRVRLKQLSAGQLKVLTLVAEGIVKELTGKTSQHKLNMAGASIVKAVEALRALDFIHKDDKYYYVVDPLVASMLTRYELTNIE